MPPFLMPNANSLIYSRAHKGRDQEIEKNDLDLKVSIHAPTRGATRQ